MISRCNTLQPDKYYIHAYQVRFLVNNNSRSLNSRAMASELSSMFPDTYHPRRSDIATATNSHEPRLPNNRSTNLQEHRLPQRTTRPPTFPNFKPPGLPTPFVPLHNLPQPYPMQTVPIGTPFLQQPTIPNPNIQPIIAPHVPYVYPQLPLQRTQFQTSAPVMHPRIPQLSYAQAANPSDQQNTINAMQRPQNLPAPQQNRNNA